MAKIIHIHVGKRKTKDAAGDLSSELRDLQSLLKEAATECKAGHYNRASGLLASVGHQAQAAASKASKLSGN